MKSGLDETCGKCRHGPALTFAVRVYSIIIAGTEPDYGSNKSEESTVSILLRPLHHEYT